MRTPLVAGNWKMFKTVHEAVVYAKEFRSLVKDIDDVEIVVAPPFMAVHAVAEAARNSKLIGASLEARVVLEAGEALYPLLSRYQRDLPSVLIVSEVELKPVQDAELVISVERTGGVKCERCWKYTRDVGSDSAFPTICASCAASVREARNAA